MNDLISDEDKHRLNNQLEEPTEMYSINNDDDVKQDENGFYIESKNKLSKENTKI